MEINEDNYSKTGTRSVTIRDSRIDGMRQAFESITILEESRQNYVGDAVASLWNSTKENPLDYSANEMFSGPVLPETIEKIKVDGRKAAIYVQRGDFLMPRMNDEWTILIGRKSGDLNIGSPSMLHPYYTKRTSIFFDAELQRQNEDHACAFWTFVKSLKIPD